MAVRIPDQETLMKPQLSLRLLHDAGRDELDARPSQSRRHPGQVPREDPRLAVEDIVRASLGSRPPVPRREILEKLDRRPARGLQARDAEPGSKDVVQVLLLRAVVLALAGHGQPQRVAIEGEALFG